MRVVEFKADFFEENELLCLCVEQCLDLFFKQ